MKNNQKGFISHFLLGALFVVVIGAVAGGFLYVKNQNQEDVKKDQAISEANSKISKLESNSSIPEGWQTFTIGGGQKAVLPKDYKLSQELNGTYLFSNPNEQYDNVFLPKIAVHQYSAPSINYNTFSYDAYCQLNNGTWSAYNNANNVQTADTSTAAKNACSKIESESSNGVNYYSFENQDGYKYHAAYVVKAGPNYYVLNFEKYFNNYGNDAIQASAAAAKKSMIDTAEKIVLANK